MHRFFLKDYKGSDTYWMAALTDYVRYADHTTLGTGEANRKLFNLIQQMQQEGLIKFTQLIWEGDGRWIHISYVPSDLRCQVIG